MDRKDRAKEMLWPAPLVGLIVLIMAHVTVAVLDVAPDMHSPAVFIFIAIYIRLFGEDLFGFFRWVTDQISRFKMRRHDLEM